MKNSPTCVADLIRISFATPRTKEDATRTKPSHLFAAGIWLAWQRRWALSWMQLRLGLSWMNSCPHMKPSTCVSWGKSWALWEKKRQRTAGSYQTCCASCTTLVKRRGTKKDGHVRRLWIERILFVYYTIVIYGNVTEPSIYPFYCNHAIFAIFPGADFTNTFRLLSRVPWPEEGDSERATVGPVVELILEQCASIEELKVANKPTMEDRWGSVWWLDTRVFPHRAAITRT